MAGHDITGKPKRKSAGDNGPLPGLPGGDPADGAAPFADLPIVDQVDLPKPRATRKIEVKAPVAAPSERPMHVDVSPPTPVVTMAEPVIEPAMFHKVADASPVAEPNPVPAMPATLAEPLEGLNTMATVATPFPANAAEATDKAQAMFGDMNSRFKSAFEKSSKMGEEMVEMTKGNVEALVASAKIAAKATETLGQEAAEYGKKSLETTVAMFKSLAAVKSPTELFQLQSDFAKSSFDSVVAEASKFSESLMKVAGEVAQPLSSRYAVAAEKVKTASL